MKGKGGVHSEALISFLSISQLWKIICSGVARKPQNSFLEVKEEVDTKQVAREMDREMSMISKNYPRTIS